MNRVPKVKDDDLDLDTARLCDDPELVSYCREVADEVLQQRIEAERHVIEVENERLYRDELRKLERIHDYRLARSQRDLHDAESILARLEGSDNPDDRRIIPVHRGRVDKAQQAIAEIETRFGERSQDLESRRDVTYGSILEAAAFVFGTSVSVEGLSAC